MRVLLSEHYLRGGQSQPHLISASTLRDTVPIDLTHFLRWFLLRVKFCTIEKDFECFNAARRAVIALFSPPLLQTLLAECEYPLPVAWVQLELEAASDNILFPQYQEFLRHWIKDAYSNCYEDPEFYMAIYRSVSFKLSSSRHGQHVALMSILSEMLHKMPVSFFAKLSLPIAFSACPTYKGK